MGSETPLKKISLNELVDQQTQYLKKRVPSIGKNIELKIESTKDISIQGNTTL